MSRIIVLAFTLFFFLVALSEAARVKDVANIKGVRDNMLIGYGLVVGLKGTGDSEADITSKSMLRLFKKMGVETATRDFKSKNVAAVILTAKLPPFSRAGSKIDVRVSSIGDAESLEGGTLLVTPLRAGDQNVYAVAQGSVSIGKVSGGGGGGGQGGETFPTTGRIPGGAIIEREVAGNFSKKKTFILSLNQPDFTTSARLARIINTELGGQYAVSRDAGTVDIIVPFNYEGKAVELMAMIEKLKINPDTKARVVLNERTGTIVIGANVQISDVAIAHGDLEIEVGGGGGGGGKKKGGEAEKVGIISGATIKDVVKALNALGVAPKDLTAIFQALRASGALQADLEVM